jgi:hypothetical protein
MSVVPVPLPSARSVAVYPVPGPVVKAGSGRGHTGGAPALASSSSPARACTAAGASSPAGPSSPAGASSPATEAGGGEIEVIRVVGWPDPVIDRLGFDPRSLYVETFWLGILGPTCTWLMRRLATGLEEQPAGFDLHLADTARALGLGSRSGRQSPFRRALARCVSFQVARREGPMTLAVRRRLPPLPRRHLLRLPTALQESHAQWMIPSRSSPVLEEARRNARRLALGLMASDKERPEVELQLVRWQVHPAIAHEATQWAWAFRAHEATGALGTNGSSSA